MADVVRCGDCCSAICNAFVDAKDFGWRWNIKRCIGDEDLMVDGSTVFFFVAKGDDYSCKYLDWRAVHNVDVFGDYYEYSLRLL